ncbi:MAG: hypothetical protein FJY76_03605 [Candidatus Aenigmarchaeota archaeon]|nr:hypothetical protein [Candidatus Aenigmarchaeota archaeon]
MVGKIRIMARDDDSITFRFLDGELSGTYVFVKDELGDPLHSVYKDGTAVETKRAQEIVSGLVKAGEISMQGA